MRLWQGVSRSLGKPCAANAIAPLLTHVVQCAERGHNARHQVDTTAVVMQQIREACLEVPECHLADRENLAEGAVETELPFVRLEERCDDPVAERVARTRCKNPVCASHLGIVLVVANKECAFLAFLPEAGAAQDLGHLRAAGPSNVEIPETPVSADNGLHDDGVPAFWVSVLARVVVWWWLDGNVCKAEGTSALWKASLFAKLVGDVVEVFVEGYLGTKCNTTCFKSNY